mgnify:CR=1 FL=1
MSVREGIRDKIDSIDERILDALSERVSLARQIGEYKKKMGLPVIDAAREHTVLRRIGEEAARKGLPRERCEAIYREIIQLCRSVQMEEIRVAFLGPRGTFCEQAARDHFHDAKLVLEERPSIADIFRSVRVHEADHGVVPIENSNEGSVVATLDLLNKSDLMISGEVILRIKHNLIVRPDMDLDDIVEVASHSQALAQCRRYIEENLPNVRQVETRSTAAAVKLASESDGVAAIATELAAELYGMKILASEIEDNPENHTRFFVLGREDREPTGKDRTSVLFSVEHRPGSLHEALGALSSRMINLSKIESRPARGKPWEYIFFCDFEGHRMDEKCHEALEELQQKTINLKVLGSYPRAQQP